MRPHCASPAAPPRSPSVPNTAPGDRFIIRAYSKKELALLYFPHSNSFETAVHHLMRWIRKCTPLLSRLREAGYADTQKFFKSHEVRLIIEYIGEP